MKNVSYHGNIILHQADMASKLSYLQCLIIQLPNSDGEFFVYISFVFLFLFHFIYSFIVFVLRDTKKDLSLFHQNVTTANRHSRQKGAGHRKVNNNDSTTGKYTELYDCIYFMFENTNDQNKIKNT